ncbi:DUF3578 domain-containing protein [Gottfriedia sp. S16(2024)]|uniref:MrcB family domain-containing protein n=1 Tax=Gottfriedia sp. S16(2024) TaxID=3162883 RepID=UPI003D1E4E0A
MIEKVFFEMAKRNNEIKTLGEKKINWITKVDDKGIYIETESSREKYNRGEKVNPFEIITFDYILQGWQEFINRRKITAKEFDKARGRSSFLMAFFAQLPFIEVSAINNTISIKLKEFQTDEIPCEQYHKVKTFIDEVNSGKYDPKQLSTQTNGNLYRVKSKSRQDSRLLGFIDEFNEVNKTQMFGYIEAEDKDEFIKKILLNQGYFRISLIYLDLLNDLPKKEKKNALEELGMLTVYNSKGDNLMVESVAKERTHNLLMWLEKTKLIDQNWCTTENFFETLTAKENVMNTNIRGSLIKVMNEYLAAKSEGSGGHQLGSFIRKEIPEEFYRLPFINTSQYVVTGSIGKGNWAFVPWVAIMNQNITDSTQRGYYIVYLFSEDMKRVYLTLAQGVKETSKEEMRKIKAEIRDSFSLSSKVRKDDNINLGSSKKARDYALSTAAYIAYNIENMPDESVLVSDLEEMVQIYENFILIKNGNQTGVEYMNPTESESFVKDKKNDYIPSKELIEHIYSYIKSKGFIYSKEEVINLFLSLKTKPFVILSGISGTGKTKMVQWFAESLGANEGNGQFTLIPVRPDWSDGSDLLGYVDIKGEFKVGPLTRAIKAANGNPNFPYFVLLDEMNLARVEYYFSDILSVMESRKWENGEIISSLILSKDISGEDITLPNNLYVIGTVNMDETTHPFSKKVLDRANTIEFNRVDLGSLNFLLELDEVEPVEIGQNQLSSKYLYLKDLYKKNSELVERVTNEIVKINQVLQGINAHVGYRVRDEICFYVSYNEEGDLMPFELAFDHCILQKILPRIAGSDTRVELVLRELYKLFTNTLFDEENELIELDLQNAIYPNSTSKIVEMLRRLREDGFTSFWIS